MDDDHFITAWLTEQTKDKNKNLIEAKQEKFVLYKLLNEILLIFDSPLPFVDDPVLFDTERLTIELHAAFREVMACWGLLIVKYLSNTEDSKDYSTMSLLLTLAVDCGPGVRFSVKQNPHKNGVLSYVYYKEMIQQTYHMGNALALLTEYTELKPLLNAYIFKFNARTSPDEVSIFDDLKVFSSCRTSNNLLDLVTFYSFQPVNKEIMRSPLEIDYLILSSIATCFFEGAIGYSRSINYDDKDDYPGLVFYKASQFKKHWHFVMLCLCNSEEQEAAIIDSFVNIKTNDIRLSRRLNRIKRASLRCSSPEQERKFRLDALNFIRGHDLSLVTAWLSQFVPMHANFDGLNLFLFFDYTVKRSTLYHLNYIKRFNRIQLDRDTRQIFKSTLNTLFPYAAIHEY